MKKFFFVIFILCLAVLLAMLVFREHIKYSAVVKDTLTVPVYNSSDRNQSVPISKQFPPTTIIQDFAVSFEFRPDSFEGFPNLFQTAPVNEGLRMEFGESSSLAIIAGKDERGGIRGLEISPRVSTGTFHKVEIYQHFGNDFQVFMDGRLAVTLPSGSMRWEMSNVVVGCGFDANRVFYGQIRNFKMNYMAATERVLFRGKNFKKACLGLMLLSVIAFLLVFADRIVRFAAASIHLILRPKNAKLIFFAGIISSIAHVLLILSGSFDLDNLRYKVLKEIRIAPISVVDSKKSAVHPSIGNPTAAVRDDIKEAEFEFDFNVKSYAGFPNLFQTAPYNKGIRMEFGPTGQLALVASRGASEGIEGRVVNYQISSGTWHHMRVGVSADREITVQIDNVKNAISSLHAPDINLDFSQIVIGSGFDGKRVFDGDVRNFTVHYRILKLQKPLFLVGKTVLFAGKLLLALMPVAVLWYFAFGSGCVMVPLSAAVWVRYLAIVAFALLTGLSSAKYLFGGLEVKASGLMASILPDLASVKYFVFSDNIRNPQFYIWGLPFLAMAAAILFLARRNRTVAAIFVTVVAITLLGLAKQVIPGAVTLLLMFASYGIGSRICTLVRADEHKDGFALPFTIGISFNGIAFWSAAHFQVNYPVTHLYFLVAELLVSYRPIWRLLGQGFRSRAHILSAGQIAILCFAILSLPNALTPHIGWDGQIAHIYMAKQTVLFGYFDFSPFYPYGLDQAIIPKGIFSVLFMLSGLAGVKVCKWLLFAVSFWMLEKFVRERFNPMTAFFTALICMLTPSLLWQIQFVFIDVFEFSFGVILLLHWFNTLEDRSLKNLLLFFALSALSYYGKQSNVIIVIPLALTLAISPAMRMLREKDYLPVGRFLAAALICPVMLAPSFWINYHATGNPMFQYFNSVFKSFYFPIRFEALLPAPFIDPWRLIADITFHGARNCYYGFLDQAFGTWFYALLPIAMWVLAFSRHLRDTVRLAAVFLISALLFLYLIPPQIRYFDSILPSGALLLALGITVFFELANTRWLRLTLVFSLLLLSTVNLLATFKYQVLEIQYPLRYLIKRAPIPRGEIEPEHAERMMQYASKAYGKYSKCLLYYSPVMSMADFHVEVYDWYNYRLGRELSSTANPELLYNIIFKIKKFDFLILTDNRPATNLDLLVLHGLIVPAYHVPGYTLYKPVGMYANKLTLLRKE